MPKQKLPKDPIDAIIAENVARRRRRAVMSQEKLGEAIGVTFQQVQKYERGENRIAASRLIRIARALNCTITDLVPEEDRW